MLTSLGNPPTSSFHTYTITSPRTYAILPQCKLAMAYVPPHHRRREDGGAAAADADRERKSTRYTLNEIEKHFWPGVEHRSAETTTTLHASASTPDKASFALLWVEANPRWDKERIIFVKTNLHLLPLISDSHENDEDEATTSAHQRSAETGDDLPKPIAFFKQTHRRQAGSARAFSFAGWYQVEKVEFLAPNSPDLIRMLEQKCKVSGQHGWPPKNGRHALWWKKSLRHRWAVVKLVEDIEALKQRGKPDIEVLPDGEGQPKKSVKEMLAELRLDGDAERKSESGEVEETPETGEPLAIGRSNGSVGD